MIGAPLWETYGNLQFPIVAPDLVQCATSRGMLEFLRTATGLQGCKAEVVEGMPSEHVSPSTISEPSSIKIYQTLILVLSLSWCNL